MSEMDRHESRGDEIAAYLLGALDAGETAALERHLDGCPECRGELLWLRPALNTVPESVARLEPPRELRARILEEAEADARRGRKGAVDASPSRRRLFAGWRPLAGLTAIALIAVVVGYSVGGGDTSGGPAANPTTVAAGKAPGVTARVISYGDSGTLDLANVRSLPPNRVLEAWVQRGTEVKPVRALFVPDSEGRATTTIPNMKDVDAVMVTAEPRGGSPAPTSPPMVTIELPQPQ